MADFAFALYDQKYKTWQLPCKIATTTLHSDC